MALIKVGSINDFSVAVKSTTKSKNLSLRGIKTFAELSEISKSVEPDSFELFTSADERAIGLKKLELTEGFEGFLQGMLNPTNELYFVVWAWDLSGQPIYQYPGTNTNSTDVIIPLKVGRVKDFLGQGLNIFPKRKVKGGIAVRIQLWESDQSIRNFGKAMSDTADAIKKSELTNLISLVSLVTGVAGATVTLIKDAAIELAKIIGTILQANGDDYVDFFEGYYAADQNWLIGDDVSTGNSSIITLNKY